MADGSRDAPHSITDADVRRLCRELAPLQALDADRQGVVVAPDRAGRGTPDPDGRRVAQIAHGDLERARVAWDRLGRSRARTALLWVVEVSHLEPTANALALHLGATHGPVADREALPIIEARALMLSSDADTATTLERVCHAAHGALAPATLLARAARTEAEGRKATAEAQSAKTRARLVAWGREVLAGALRAWEDAGA